MAWRTGTSLPSEHRLAASRRSFVAGRLQRDLPASLFVTIHLPSHSRSMLDQILTHAGPLPAAFAKDGDVLRKSRVYIAPPNRHLIVDGDRLLLCEGSRENNARPAIDPMLRSAAVCCGSRAIGVVLTGTYTYTAELMSLALDENLRRALASALRAGGTRCARAQALQPD